MLIYGLSSGLVLEQASILAHADAETAPPGGSM
jgi:hypothetical protein